MSSSFNRIKKNIIEAMQSTNNQGTSAYDSVAEVRRVEGDTAWVHIAGGVDETPVKLTIAAKAGDVVQVRVGGGRAWITGNASAPPTDDKTAIAAKSLADIAGNRANTAKVAAEAAQVAADGAQADIDSQKEYFWHDANGAHVLGSKTAATRYRTDIDSEGMHIKDVSGEVQEVAKFTADGTQIGKTGEAHQELDYHSWRLTDKDGNVFAEVKDLRGKDGTATIIAKFKGDGETTEFSLPVTATEIVDITVDGTSTEATLTELNTEIKFVSAPAQKAKIICTYKTDDERAKSYTFGKRVANKNTGAYSFAEGINAVASGKCSHSEGLGGYAEGNCSHAEGWATTASEDCAHAEGIGTHAKGYCSHAEGKQTEAQGDWSHSAGYRTIAGFDNQMVIGSYNDNKEDSLFEIGNGTYRSHSNAFRVTKDGKVVAGDGIYAGGNSHVEGHLTTRGLVNNMQAGRVSLEASGTTKTVNGTKYYELKGTVKFATAFENKPMISLVPLSGAGYQLLPPTVDNRSEKGFTAIMYRNSDTGTSVMWTAMAATQ